MLERDDVQSLIAYAWNEIGCGVRIPADWTDFFHRNGRTPAAEQDRRRFARYYFRDQAVLIAGKTLHCVYTADISCSGVALLHFEQLFPKQEFHLCLPNGTAMNIRIERCHRVGEFCYECGAAFTGAMSSVSAASACASKLAT